MESRKTNKDNELEAKEYKFQGTGLTALEKRWAKRRFKDYCVRYSITALSDLLLLEELVHREIYQQKLHKKIGELSKDTKAKTNKDGTKKETKSEIVPTYIIRSLNENLNQILILKEKLGLFAEKKEDEYKAFEILEKKFGIYKDEHIEEFEVDCPFCAMKFFLNRRTDKYQPSKLILFKDKVLCNSELWSLYKLGKITKEEFAKILNVSENYIEWLESKIYNNPSE